ncbi:class F sortase [Actinacidiphila sp. bgisy160]|uniref:class F sortase n=1 Tax=Actinacidiphila sp. bgisy160 TaxID=3413796 RepID=UPI003D737080
MTPGARWAAALAVLAVLPWAGGCAGGSGDVRVAAPPVASASAPAAAGRTHSSPPSPLARSVPVRLRIPAIGVDTPVMELGLAPDGTVEVPPVARHSPAGWYRHSPAPGQLGPSVLLAHVTVGRFGDGVFRHLARLRPGDRIVAGLRDGASAEFTVDRVRTVAKERFPAQEVYGDVDRPELRLITCGGPRTADGSGYRDNVVVYASLTSVGRA